MYIACPKCDWRPDGRPYWVCTNCQHRWDTFATHGLCPKCGKDWKETRCPICGQWSDHEDWYHEESDMTVEEYIANYEQLSQPLVVPIEPPNKDHEKKVRQLPF